MDFTFEELTELGCRQCSIDYMSMAADVLRLEFVGALMEHVSLPFAVGDALRVLQDGECVFRGWVTSVEPTMDTQVWVTNVVVQNVVAVLDALPVEVSSYEKKERLESARDMVQQALSAVRQCAMLAEERFELHLAASVMAVFSSGTESVWSNILAVSRWVPNAASWYDHRSGTLHLLGGTVALGERAVGGVVFPAESRCGVLQVGDDRLELTDAWLGKPATMAAQLLRGSLSVEARAVDAFMLQLTARAPGEEGNSIALSFAPGADAEAVEVIPFARGSASQGVQLATMESLQQAELPGAMVSMSSRMSAWEVPPVVALRGRFEFTLPLGASIYQPGAFVYHVPKREVSVGSGDVEKQAPAVQRVGGEWHIVKGYEVPPGWQTVNKGEAVNMRLAVNGAPGLHHEFWARYLPEIRKTNVSCLAFGVAVFEPMPVAEAYPEADEDDETRALEGVVKWRPPLLESRNGPANYEEFKSGGNNKLYVCYEGQFPASSDHRGNVSGLKFCRGTLRQFVWLKSKYTGVLGGTEVQAFFAGNMKVTGDDGKEETVSYTQLTLEGVFINRRRTRYQSGTNGQPEKTLGDGTETGGEQNATELTQRDYIQALTDYYYSSRPVGTHGTVQLAKVGAYRHGIGLGLLKSVRWYPATGALTLTTGAGGPVGMEAMLRRQQVGKMQALADLQDGLAQESQPVGDDDEPKEEVESYPMVGGGASAGHRVDTTAARLEPFAVYMEDDGRMMMNGGPLPSPSGIIQVEAVDITAQWKEGRQFFVKAEWNRTKKCWEPKILYVDPVASDV